MEPKNAKQKNQTLLDAIFTKFKECVSEPTGQKGTPRRGVQGVSPLVGRGRGWDGEARLFPRPLCELGPGLCLPGLTRPHLCGPLSLLLAPCHRVRGVDGLPSGVQGSQALGLWLCGTPLRKGGQQLRAARSPRPGAPLAALPFGCPQGLGWFWIWLLHYKQNRHVRTSISRTRHTLCLSGPQCLSFSSSKAEL